MDPDPLESRLILFGVNPAAVDAAAAVLMGFEIEHLPIVKNAFAARAFPICDGEWGSVELTGDDVDTSGRLGELAHRPALLDVRPHFGWIGHVEANGHSRQVQQV